jgi:plasmid replication initiation protein
MGKEGKRNCLVTKSNSLIEARYRLSVQEQRLLAIMVSDINPEDRDFKKYRYRISDILEWLDIEDKGYYKKIREVTRRLLTRVVTIHQGNTLFQTTWLAGAKYYFKEGVIELSFHPDLKPYLLQLKECFTKYALKNVLELKSKYAFRLYELLKQYQAIGTRKFSLKELRELLGIEQEELKLWIDFKRRVLEISKREINAKTDIKIDYKTEKVGRKIKYIIFSIETKEKVNKITDKQKPVCGELEEKTDKYINICEQYEGKRVKFGDKIGRFFKMNGYYIFILENDNTVVLFDKIKQAIDKGLKIEILE